MAVVQSHYTCVACNERVSLVPAHRRVAHRQTIPVRAHFSHHAHSTCTATGESVHHLAAKLTVQQEVQRSGVLRFLLRCPDCERTSVKKYVLKPREGIGAEMRVGDHRLDLAVMDLDTKRPVLGIEVRHTHAVTPQKARALGLPWFEITTTSLFGQRGGHAHLEVVNSNCFVYQPCPCGNDAFSYQEAQDRAARRRTLKRQQAREQQLAQERREAERRRADRAARQAQLAALHRDQLRRQTPQASGPPTPEQHAAFRQRLLAALPDVFDRLLAFTCVLGPCPGCGEEQIFFDSSGMNMMPTWSTYVMREQPAHPWHCRCVACGWHGQKPPAGLVFVLRGNAFDPAPPSRLVLPRTQGQPQEGTFWWQDTEEP